MLNLSSSFILIAVIVVEIIHGSLAGLISTHSELFEVDFSWKLGEPMDRCDKLEDGFLSLVNVGLKVVKDHFVESDTVKSMNLENNMITDISPNAFKFVPNLSCLNMRHNHIRTIFEHIILSFNPTSKMTKLNLANALFRNITHNHTDPMVLLSDEKIDESAIIKLPFLTHLDMSSNNLTKFPSNFKFSFPNLTHLYLSDNKLHSSFLSEIPPSTQYLYLERNGYDIEIDKLPNNIHGLFFNENKVYQNVNLKGRFPNLRVLSFRKCNHYYTFVRSLDKKKLVDVDLSLNNISRLSLTYLKDATSLQRLSLDHNSIYTLYFLRSLQSLTDLSVFDNKIEYITDNSLATLNNLRKLNLRRNQIAIITESAFLKLVKLEILDLAENNLFWLPRLWMKNLTNIKYLNLNSNKFSFIEGMHIQYANSNLHHLFFANNNFTRINMNSLRNLSHNTTIHVTLGNNSTCIM
ncbi:hypothetical protein M0802_002787 [Mischocyttarus mexicanus]|nr:hypothetical protein M0802_002787 [Mischocyttarus mexicanus]